MAATQESPPVATAAGPSSTPAEPAEVRSPKPQAPGRDKDSFQTLLLDRCITRDSLHSAALTETAKREAEFYKTQRLKIDDYRALRTDLHKAFPPSRLYGQGYNGFANGHTDGPPRLLYPQHKPRPGKRQAPVLRWKKKDIVEQAQQHEELVPVRLDIDWDQVKLRDTFTWNLHDRLVGVDVFTAQLLEDFGLDRQQHGPVYDQVYQQIMEQLVDFYPMVYSEEDALDPELPYSAYKNDDMRLLIKLNITIGQHTLVDQFEWEINNPHNSPEEFAASMSRELALSGEFTTAIAHCIREQVQLFTKSLYIVGHPFDGRPVEDPDLVSALLPSPLVTVFRPQQQAKDFAPFLWELSEADLERNETVFSREQRRQKRSVNRRGGPQLPDLKDRQRTIRTLVVSSVLPGSAASIEESQIFKRTAGATGPRGKGRGRDGDISDSEDSEDSAPDSPAAATVLAQQGTARTRGLRGAATVAHQRLANLGRSETPEAMGTPSHEARGQRRLAREAREDTDEPKAMIVTLKVSPDRLRKLSRTGVIKRGTPKVAQATIPSATRSSSASGRTPTATPATSVPTKPQPPKQIGNVPAAPPPPPGQPAPPPVSRIFQANRMARRRASTSS